MAGRVNVSSSLTNSEMNSSSWYAIAAIIVVLILCYLILTLIKPEKF